MPGIGRKQKIERSCSVVVDARGRRLASRLVKHPRSPDTFLRTRLRVSVPHSFLFSEQLAEQHAREQVGPITQLFRHGTPSGILMFSLQG